MYPELRCVLCGNDAQVVVPFERDVIHVECERCGKFQVSIEAESSVLALKPQDKARLSAYCRRSSDAGHFAVLLTNNIGSAIQSSPQYSPPEKLDRLLETIAAMSPKLGGCTKFRPERDYPLIGAEGAKEISFLLRELCHRGLVHMNASDLSVKIEGWRRLEEIRSKERNSTRVFVAMWFADGMNEVYDQAIKPAVLEAGYEPLRIDQFEHVNRIDDEIVGQIRRSRFMVADFTGQRHGVYFEAGMMLGLGRNVIWMCNKSELSDVHFDNRQYNFIDYETLGEAKKRLYDRIIAVEGEGPGVQRKSAGAGK